MACSTISRRRSVDSSTPASAANSVRSESRRFSNRGRSSSDPLGEIMRANEHSRLMLEAMPGPAYTLAPTGELEFCNQQLLDLFGTTLQELRDWAGRLHPDDLDRVPAKFSRCMAAGEPFDDV